MRTVTWVWAAALGLVFPAGVMAGCGDDTGTGGSGGDPTTTTTTGVTTSSTTSSTTGQGGGGAPPNDTCSDPEIVQVALNETATIMGTTNGAADDYKDFCADLSSGAEAGPDVVYEIQFTDDCSAHFDLTGLDPDFDGSFTVRSETCISVSQTDLCVNDAGPGEDEAVPAALDAGTYYVVVDGAGSTSGAFTLSVRCDPQICGDGHVNLNNDEECDDGNTMDGDGCSATCQFEPSAPELDDCSVVDSLPGHSVGPGVTFIPAMDLETTLGAGDSGTGSCMGLGGGAIPAPDHTYKIVPTANGILLATIGLDQMGNDICAAIQACNPAAGCYDRAIWASTSCMEADELGCSDNPNDPAAVESVQFNVTAGTEYFIFVDGYDGDPGSCSAGAYTLRLELM
jgi:cysteine-rich repeat protein